jgi:hypothetical protein
MAAIWVAVELIQAFNQSNPQRVQMDVAHQLQCMMVLIEVLPDLSSRGKWLGISA